GAARADARREIDRTLVVRAFLLWVLARALATSHARSLDRRPEREEPPVRISAYAIDRRNELVRRRVLAQPAARVVERSRKTLAVEVRSGENETRSAERTAHAFAKEHAVDERDVGLPYGDDPIGVIDARDTGDVEAPFEMEQHLEPRTH